MFLEIILVINVFFLMLMINWFLSSNVLSQYFFNTDSIYQMTILGFLRGTEGWHKHENYVPKYFCKGVK